MRRILTALLSAALISLSCGESEVDRTEQAQIDSLDRVMDSTVQHLDSVEDSTTVSAPPTSTTMAETSLTGGTLNNATISEWKASTDANRLATSADIVMIVGSYSTPPSDLRERAVEMQACISEGGADSDDMKVAEIASACAVLLGY